MHKRVTLKLSAECGTDEAEDPERYLTVYKGDVTVWDENNQQMSVGSLRGRVVDVMSATFNGVVVEDFFDLDDEIANYHHELFNHDTNTLNADLQEEYCIDEYPVLLIIDLLQVDKDHRGKGYSLSALTALVGHIGAGCHLAILQAYPLQYSSAFKDDTSLNEFASYNKGEARERLMHHYAKAGFKPYGSDGYMILDL